MSYWCLEGSETNVSPLSDLILTNKTRCFRLLMSHALSPFSEYFDFRQYKSISLFIQLRSLWHFHVSVSCLTDRVLALLCELLINPDDFVVASFKIWLQKEPHRVCSSVCLPDCWKGPNRLTTLSFVFVLFLFFSFKTKEFPHGGFEMMNGWNEGQSYVSSATSQLIFCFVFQGTIQRKVLFHLKRWCVTIQHIKPWESTVRNMRFPSSE